MNKSDSSVSYKIIITVLIMTVCILSAFMYYNFKNDSEKAMSEGHLSKTLFMTNLRRLKGSLDADDRLSSYHFAMSAADHASAAGYGKEAVFMRKLSVGISDGAENLREMARAVDDYLENEKLPEEFLLTYGISDSTLKSELENEPSSVSEYRRWAAGKCADKIVGADDVLSPAAKNISGEYLFTCKNAYTVIDAASGAPVEVGMSLGNVPESNARLSEAECAGYAEKFIKAYFPAEIGDSVYLTGASPNLVKGTYELTYRYQNKDIKLSVKRDTGKIVRLIAR